MARVIGLAMPRWDLGTVGYVAAAPGNVDRAYSELFQRCYPTTLDMTREMRGKVSCVVSTIKRGLPINGLVFLLDPYGIANKVGTKYGIARDRVLDYVYSWFINYLITNGLLSDGDSVELDQELSALAGRVRARVGGNAAMIASVLATIIMARGVRVDELPVRVVDLRNDATNYVVSMVTSR